STASLDASGNIVVTDNNSGPTTLTVSINDAGTNVGGSSWGNHTLNTTTSGKDGDTVKTGIQIFDSQGSAHNLDIVFQKQANNTWSLTAAVDPTQGAILDNLVSNINFNENGSFSQVTGTGLGDAGITVQFNGFSTPQRINFNFGGANAFDGLTQ